MKIGAQEALVMFLAASLVLNISLHAVIQHLRSMRELQERTIDVLDKHTERLEAELYGKRGH